MGNAPEYNLNKSKQDWKSLVILIKYILIKKECNRIISHFPFHISSLVTSFYYRKSIPLYYDKMKKNCTEM